MDVIQHLITVFVGIELQRSDRICVGYVVLYLFKGLFAIPFHSFSNMSFLFFFDYTSVHHMMNKHILASFKPHLSPA